MEQSKREIILSFFAPLCLKRFFLEALKLLSVSRV